MTPPPPRSGPDTPRPTPGARRPIAILWPLAPGRAPGRPEDTPFGRSALALREEGVDVVLGGEAAGGQLRGVGLAGDRWAAFEGPVDAAWHRFPDGDRPQAWAALRDGLGPLPLGNGAALVALCRDKAESHEALGDVQRPAQVSATEDFGPALEAWGAGFLKPRFGAFGRGVRRVRPGDALPTEPGWVLQQAVPPPAGWAGWSVRVLVQRDPDGTWVLPPSALRRSREDPVVNRARGAAVAPLADAVPRDVHDAVRAVALAAARALADPWTLELGVDVVVDRDGAPWVVEVNGKPRGRLAALASDDPDRFGPAAREAALRPLRRLDALRGRRRG